MAVQRADVLTEVASSLGYSTLKPLQGEIIGSIIEGNDVLAILPTGYGKSLCYLALPFAFDKYLCSCHSIILVISPLKALLQDQVSSSNQKGVRSAYICEDNTDDHITREGVLRGSFQLVFFTPESLLTSKRWRNMLMSDTYQKNLRAVVFDEAHCIAAWGFTFRDVFQRLGEVRSLVPPQVSMLAMTATLTTTGQFYVQKTLGMQSPKTFIMSPSKKNIHYTVKPFDSINDFRELADELKTLRTETEYLQNELLEPQDAPDLSRFRMVDMFHRYTDESVKSNIVSLFTKHSSLRIVICTTAFGLGINCFDVRMRRVWPPDYHILGFTIRIKI